MQFQIGRAEQPHPNDPRFEREAEAMEAVLKAATGDAVWAVWWWCKGEAETLCLVYQGDVWRKA